MARLFHEVRGLEPTTGFCDLGIWEGHHCNVKSSVLYSVCLACLVDQSTEVSVRLFPALLLVKRDRRETWPFKCQIIQRRVGGHLISRRGSKGLPTFDWML